MIDGRPSVLILGAGINGCALARELLLNGVSVVLVDQADICSGATAYSSRLIHGGLRYLEYGELDLVRESLAERTRLLRLAPQFVRPLELFIPTGTRFGGWAAAPGRFFGWGRGDEPTGERGLWLVRAGLALYDLYARDPTLPKHKAYKLGAPRTLAVDPTRYRWECAYYDAQVEYPERFVLALLEDARRIASVSGSHFQVYTYHAAARVGTGIEIRSRAGADRAALAFEPEGVVNATGAWVDLTLEQLQIASPPLMAGTKGSHLFTFHEGLRRTLAGRGIYAEAADGRPIFITPLASTTLIGTTDIPYHGCPAEAVASQDEIQYLLASVQRILPQVGLEPRDINFHYSGVRPLPRTSADRPAAVTRRHWLERHRDAPLPLYSIIGGKLTTCRSLAQSAARTILGDLGLAVEATSEERILPGGEGYPASPAAVGQACDNLSASLGLSREAVRTVWSLCGTRTAPILEASADASAELLPGTDVPCAFVRWVIRHEWVQTLGDLVERRLMLLYTSQVREACLARLADLLVAEGLLATDQAKNAVRTMSQRLHGHYGKQIE